jgi:serine/threonine protein kinase
MNEIEIMKNLKHFSVVKLLDTIETEKYILLVMENVLGGDLLTFIKKRNKLPEKTAKFIFKQLLQSLKYIHNKNIVHRDIKLDNILIDLNNNIKLCDFGVGKYISDHHELLYDQCGTPAYIAPEVVAGEGYEGFPVDLWSSGVVLYSLLMGSIPFKAQNINELQGLIMSGNYKKTTGISKNANDLLNKLLEINPKKRINVEEALNHPWFSDNNNDNTDSLFTKAELILLSKNNADYRSCPNEEIIENFTIENLDTNKFNKNKNNKTKSFIFAPFNTSYESDKNDKNEDLNDMKLESGLCIQNNIILFEQDANALNRQYELNNNWEIDHGVIINNINDNENKIDNIPKENNYISNNDNDKINFENNNINKDDYKKNKNEQVIKIEKNDFKVEKINENDSKINKKMPFTSTRNKSNNENQIIPKSNSMIVDENIIKSMDALGYKKEYIQKCIINNDINYCFATYYLLLNSKKYID